jgi:ribosomal-protein-alanine N-acetyltransferase
VHLDPLLEIERVSFGTPWNREHFRFEIEQNPNAINRGVVLDDRLLAYACIWEIAEKMKINNIAVHPAHRRCGLGRWLLRRLLVDARGRGCNVARLEVRPSNGAAIGLYREHGFREIGRRKGYYQGEGEDAIVMEASL